MDTNSAKQAIQTWLMQDDWQVLEAQDPTAHWVFKAQSLTGSRAVVGSMKAHKDQVVIQVSTILPADEQKRLAQLSAEDRRLLLWDLRLNLAQRDTSFFGIGDPLTHIKLTEAIYFDGLTREAFMRRVAHVTTSLEIVQYLIKRALGN